MSGYKFNLFPQEVEHVNTKNRTICSKIPAPETIETLTILDKFESRSMHGQLPIVWEQAKDFSIHDSAGNKWIDFTSTIFVANIGHSNARVVEQVKSSLNDNLIASYAYATRKKAEYCKRLVEFAGANFEKVFLLSSGTEATEAAVKLMKLNGKKVGKRKNYILAISGNWHGRTMAAQLLSDNNSQKNWIQDSTDEVVHIPFPYPWLVSEDSSLAFLESSLKKLEEAGIEISKDISGIMLETFQGWGAFFYPVLYVKKIRELCDKYGILLCFDEMQAGFGRTGKNFGYEHYGVKADLICCGKGMGGGLPISGVIGEASVMDLPEIGNMSSTHSGSPLMCAAALAVLNELRDRKLVSEAARKGEILHKTLQKFLESYPKFISSVNGCGLIAAVVFDVEFSSEIPSMVSAIVEKCFQRGLLVVHTGRESIKIGPPLTITDQALIEGLEVLEKSIADELELHSNRLN